MSFGKVSVIVPSYNQACYLEKTIESLLKQSYSDLEIIVVDDGSSEPATYKLLQRVEKLPGVKVIRQMNFGLATTRNNGFLASTGDYIQFLDGDDFLDTHKIEKQMKQFAERPEVDVSLTDYYLTDSSGKKTWFDTTPKFPSFNLDLLDFLYKWDRGILCIPIHCALFKRTIMPIIPFIDGMYAKEDWVFWVTLASKNAKFSCIEEPLAFYRIHDKSSNKNPVQMGLSWLRATNEILKRIPDLPENFADESLSHFHYNYLPHFLSNSNRNFQWSQGLLPGKKRYSIRNPLVSVIMPCYNSIRTELKRTYLDMAIQSIIYQTYANWELVAVNDGSSDGTLEYLLAWAEKDSRIKVLNLSENVGVSKALNAGAEDACGKYLARMDDDDISSPRRFEYQVEMLEQEPDLDIVGAAAYIIDENNTVSCRILRCESHADSVRLALGGDSPFIHGSVMMRKSTFSRLGGYSSAEDWLWAEDYELWSRFLSGGKGANLNLPLYYYRDYALSVSKSKAEKQQQSAMSVKQAFVTHFPHVSPFDKSVAINLSQSLTEQDKREIRFLDSLSSVIATESCAAPDLEQKTFSEAETIIVSILVPAYNRPDYLKKNLDSIALQDFADYEVVITDDSPGDVLVDVVEKHPLRPKIRYYKNDTQLGPAGNWNKCAEYAHGTYIKYLHHDDYFHEPFALTKFVAALDRNPQADFAFCISQHVNENGNLLEPHVPSPSDLKRLALDFKILLEGNCIGAPSITFYRRSIHKKFEDSLKWFIDIDFYMAIFQQNPNFVYLPEPLVNVLTVSGDRVTSSCEGNFEVEIKEAFFLWEKWDGRNLREVAATDYFSGLVDRCLESGEQPDLSLLNSNEKDFYLFLLYREYVREKNKVVINNQSISGIVRNRVLIWGNRTLRHSGIRNMIDKLMPKGSQRREFAKRLKKTIRNTVAGSGDD